MDDPFALLDALPTRSAALSRGQKRTYGRVLQDDVQYGLPSPPTTSSPPPPASSPGTGRSSSPLTTLYNDAFTSRRPRSATPSPSLRTSKRLKVAATAREPPRTPTKAARTTVVAAAAAAAGKIGKMGRQTTLVATGTIRSLSSAISGGGSAVRASKRTAQAGSAAAASKDVLTQTKLNLLPARVHCKTCGMSYTRTDATDCALHDDFHRAQLDGVPVPPRLLPQSASAHSNSSGGGGSSGVVGAGKTLPGALVDTIRLGLCRPGERALVRAALEFVDLELASTLPQLDARQYTAFLYRHRNRIVGVLLCEPRSRAHRLLPGGELDCAPLDAGQVARDFSNHGGGASGVAQQRAAGAGAGAGAGGSTDEGTTRCAMGVSRMWTCRALRRRGIMSELLDFARARYVVGARVERTEVAYTQLSASGEAFLRRYLDPAAAADGASPVAGGGSAPSMLVYAD